MIRRASMRRSSSQQRADVAGVERIGYGAGFVKERRRFRGD